MTIDERLDRLTGVVESLAPRVVEHKDRIENLLKAGAEGDEAVPPRLPAR
jgi:hypothetical protein